MAELKHAGLSSGHSFEGVRSLVAGDAVNLDMRGCVRLTIILGGGATATLSRINSMAATAHSASTVAMTGTPPVIAIDWPYLRLSVAGGALDCAVV